MKPRSFLIQRRPHQGQTLFSVVFSMIVLMLIAVAVLTVLGHAFRSTRNVEPQSVAETTTANVATDLAAMAMYDPRAAGTLSHINNHTHLIMTPPPPLPGVQYPAAETQPTTVTINSVTTTANGASLTLQLAVPGASNTQATIAVSQGAPTLCDPSLPAGTVPGC